ncbi:MAG: DUF3784 domain-containing protein [Bacteroidales bacterium]|nr:DUF3784 domain-containing protein [Bacteroidales bacterium]
MVAIIIVAALLFVLGIVILSGKGDNLIAGYNTSSKKDKEKYDVKRLRLVFGLMLILLAPTCFLLNYKDYTSGLVSFIVITVLLAFVAILLGNTWAKKKK